MIRVEHGANTLDIDVAGYQFPAITDDVWDANWVQLEVAVRVGERSFRRTDPCLTAFELSGLLRWLEAMASDPPRGPVRLDFTEPNLELAFEPGPPLRLRVRLGFELLPPWAGELPAGDVERDERGEVVGMWIDLATTPEELAAVTTAARAMIARFPVRATP